MANHPIEPEFDPNDPYAHPEWRAFAKSVREDLAPRIRESALTVTLVMEDGVPDAKWAVEMGVSIMMDKPIIAVIRPGQHIPRKLAAVVDAFVEHTDDMNDLGKRLQAAIARVDPSAI